MTSGELESRAALLTDLLDATRQLEESVAVSSAILQQHGIYVWRSDVNGELLWANENLRHVLGLEPHEVSDSYWTKNLHPDDWPRIVEAWKVFVAGDGPRVFQEVYRFVRPYGESIRVLGIAYPIFTPHEQPAGFIGMLITLKDMVCC